MTSRDTSIDSHPAPHRHRVSTLESAFGLLGGPLAWFLQLCAGYALSSWPCFPNDYRRLAPLEGYAWTWSAIVFVSILAFGISSLAFLVSWRAFQRTRRESKGDHRQVLDTGTGRTRFLGLWGVIGSASFAIAVAFTAIALRVLPRCAG
jgi:hypothetical protein